MASIHSTCISILGALLLNLFIMILSQAVANVWDGTSDTFKGIVGLVLVVGFVIIVLSLLNPDNKKYKTPPNPKDIDDPMKDKMW